MRIKSYFAASVQSAIGLARREFGDDVTLVTSHASALEARHLGEYEVVFAVDEAVPSESPAGTTAQIDETNPAPLPAAEPAPATVHSKAFQDLLEEAIVAKPSTHEGLPEKLDHLHSCFIEIGIEPSMVRALMTMVERCASLSAPSGTGTMEPENEDATLPAIEMLEAVEPEPAVLVKPRFTPAEMAFMLSLSC